MQTKSYTVYQFNELSDEAKQKAIEDYRGNTYEYSWSDEYAQTLKEFANYYPVKIKDYNISPYSYSSIDWEYTGDEQYRELTGLDLAKHLWNHYENDLFEGKYYGKLVTTEKDGTKIEKSPLHPAGFRHVKRYSNVIKEPRMFTGFIADWDITRPLHDALKGTYRGTFEELLGDCLESFKDCWIKDMEWQDSDEYITEQLQINNYQFTEDGEID